VTFVPKKPPRDKWLHLKCTEAERDLWGQKAEAAGLTVADFLRDALGSATEKKPRARARKADPVLLAQVARVGNNLNQVAHWCNTYSFGADRVQLLAVLLAIEEHLEMLTETQP